MGHGTSERRRQEDLEKLAKLERTTNRKDTIRLVLILCSATPFLFFLHTAWGHAALLGYLMTALLFGLGLVGLYPPVGTSWFWKAIVPIVLLHSAIISGVVWANLNVPEMNRLPRMLYGFAAIILVGEWWLSQRIINVFQPK
jgi:hypothetical protein